MKDTHETQRPLTVLIAALGGEGGGVLASWLHRAAIAEGHFVHGTSVPGVAQRTGATTYYMEIVPGAGSRHAGTQPPVLALNAAPGEVDVLVASELLEATRAVQAGFVTPDRTLLIVSTARVYTVDEKSAMGDGRLDSARMQALVQRFARHAFLADLGAEAARLASPLSAVLLGAIAARGALPITCAAFRTAIAAEGKAVDANLRGFEGGLAIASSPAPPVSEGQVAPAVSITPVPRKGDPHLLHDVPAHAHDIVAEGIARLTDYQGPAYAESYIATVRQVARLPGADGALVMEFARHLALRMSVEDVIRVAQLKLRQSRIERVRAEAKAAPGDIVDITEYLKPGPEEMLGLLPPGLGQWLLARVPRTAGWPMTVRTTRLSGYLRLRALAGLRRWRPRTLRFAQEAAWRRRWVALIERTLAKDVPAAREVVAMAALVRGYADTYARGWANFDRIAADLIEPMLAGRLPAAIFADALLQARLAASKDPDGETLSATLSAIGAMAQPNAIG